MYVQDASTGFVRKVDHFFIMCPQCNYSKSRLIAKYTAASLNLFSYQLTQRLLWIGLSYFPNFSRQKCRIVCYQNRSTMRTTESVLGEARMSANRDHLRSRKRMANDAERDKREAKNIRNAFKVILGAPNKCRLLGAPSRTSQLLHSIVATPVRGLRPQFFTPYHFIMAMSNAGGAC
jgi:hypothetical protein